MAQTVNPNVSEIPCSEGNLWEQDPMTKMAPQITPKELERRLDIVFRNLMDYESKPEEEKKRLEAQYTRLLPIFIFGPPGIGKSQIVESLGEKYNVQVETYIASTMDPTQVQGLPYPIRSEQATTWFPDIRFKDTQKKTRIYFFDELNMAPPATQAAFYRLILEGRLGSIDISHALRIGAGNRVSDYYNVQQMGLPLATRFEVYLVRPDVSDWIEWAEHNKLNHYVVDYARYARDHNRNIEKPGEPALWFCINPKEPSLARATPRSWERLSKLITIGLDTKEDIIGAIGVNPGLKFLDWYTKQKEEEKGKIGRHTEYPGKVF